MQIGYASGSNFTITYNNGPTRAVPLERATVAAPAGTDSPAQLMRARSESSLSSPALTFATSCSPGSIPKLHSLEW